MRRAAAAARKRKATKKPAKSARRTDWKSLALAHDATLQRIYAEIELLRIKSEDEQYTDTGALWTMLERVQHFIQDGKPQP